MKNRLKYFAIVVFMAGVAGLEVHAMEQSSYREDQIEECQNVLRKENGIQYEVFDGRDMREMMEVIADAFSKYEPMTRVMQISKDEIVRHSKGFCQKAVEEQLTIIARDAETENVVGVALANDLMRESSSGGAEFNGKFSPIGELLQGLDKKYRQRKQLHLGECLNLSMLAVDRKYTGKKIAKNLVELCMENGKRKGYELSVTEATAAPSQHIFREFGFETLFTTPYKTFEYRGERVFAFIESPDSALFMERCLR